MDITVRHKAFPTQGSYFPLENHQPKDNQDKEEGLMGSQMLQCHKALFYLATLSLI